MIKGAIFRGRIRTVEDAIDAWKSSHADAMEVRDFEDVVRESISALEALGDFQRESWNALKAGKLTNILEHGRRLGDAIQAGSRSVRLVTECLRQLESKGYAVDGTGELARHVKELDRIQARFAKWPFPNKDDLDKAIAEIDRGEGIDLGDWIRTLQNEADPTVGSGDNQFLGSAQAREN